MMHFSPAPATAIRTPHVRVIAEVGGAAAHAMSTPIAIAIAAREVLLVLAMRDLYLANARVEADQENVIIIMQQGAVVKTEHQFLIAFAMIEGSVLANLAQVVAHVNCITYTKFVHVRTELQKLYAFAMLERSVIACLDMEKMFVLATTEPIATALVARLSLLVLVISMFLMLVSVSLEPQRAIAVVTTEPVLANARVEAEAVLAVATDDVAATCRENLNRRKVWKHM